MTAQEYEDRSNDLSTMPVTRSRDKQLGMVVSVDITGLSANVSVGPTPVADFDAFLNRGRLRTGMAEFTVAVSDPEDGHTYQIDVDGQDANRFIGRDSATRSTAALLASMATRLN